MPYEVLEDQEPALAGYEILPESEAGAGFEIIGPATEGLPTQPSRAPLDFSRPLPDESELQARIPGVFSDMASGEGPGAFETAMQPIVELPAVPAKFMQGVLSPLLPGEMGAQIGEGAGKFVSKAASSLLSPGMIALAGIGAVAPPVAGAVIAGMGAAGLGPAAVEALEASKRGDVAGFTEFSLDAGMAGLMASGGARGVIGRRGVEGGKEGRGVMALLPNRVDQSLQPLASKTVGMMLNEGIESLPKPPVLPRQPNPLEAPIEIPIEPIVEKGTPNAEVIAETAQTTIEVAPVKPGETVVRGQVNEASPELRPAEGTDVLLTPEPVPQPATPSTGLVDTPRSKGTGEELFAVGAETSPEMIGMGGAIPSEFQNPRLATAMKYKLIDAERAQRGLEPLIKPQGLSDAQALEKAMAKQDMEPLYVETLIKDIIEEPRVIDDWQNHLLNLRKIDLRNELHRSMREGLQAAEDGRLDDVAAITPRTQIWSERLAEVELASRLSGSKRGSALRSLQVMVNEDFSLAQMKMEKLADRKFKRLSPEAEAAENVELAKRSDELLASNKAFQARVLELEALQRQAELDKSLAEAKVAAVKTYPPSVLDAAERIVSGWEKRAESASARLRSKLAQLGAAPDPTIVLDVAEIGLAKFGRGVLDFAKWSEAMIADFGPKVEPFLKDAFDAAQKLLTLESEKIKGPISEQVKRKIKNVDVAEKITGAKEKIGNKLEQGDDANVTPSVRQLVRALVEQDPKITHDQLVDTVHDVLKEFVPEMTRIEAMDAISGRGKFWLPPQDVVSKTVRDLSTQIRLVAHQQDVLAKKPLPRTGYQPEPMSDIARQEQQKLNELKRRHGVVVTDPASQLASTLAARKTYYTHRLADLRQEIASGERIVKTKSPSPTDPALESLKAEYETTKAEHDAIFGKREMTDAQRVQIAMNAVEKSITDLESRIKAGDIGPRSRASKTPNTPELEASRARRDALREELQELRDLAAPKKTPEEIALQSLRARLARENANLRDRMARGDFSPKPKAPIDISKDARAMSLAAEHEKLKRDYQQSRAKDQAARMTAGQKTWANVKETINLHRNYITAFDLPPVFRQGGFISLGNPARAARNFVRSLSAISKEQTALRIEQEILHRPNATLYARFKLELPSFHENRLSVQEEMVMSRLAQRIPGLRASNRGFITFLNLMRADTFDAMIKNMAKDPKNPTALEGSATANYINVTTGRGPLAPKIKASSELLSTAFFAPRLLISRVQLLAGQPLYKGNARTRALIALEYGKALTGGAAVFGLAMLAGAEVETDPRSSDFLKLKFGDTRLDPLMGLQQVTVLLAREIFTRETKSLRTGKVSPIFGDKVPYGGETGGKIGVRFLRTKIAPSLGTAWDVWSGEDVKGDKVTPASATKNALIPISYQDIYKVMKEQGVPEGTALQMLNFMGMGLQHFDEKERRK